MAKKTRDELLAEFPDNELRQVTAQAVRDFIESLLGVYGIIYNDTGQGAAAQTGIDTNWTLLTGWAGSGDSDGVTADHTTSEIVVDAGGDGKYEANVMLTLANGGGTVFELALFKNDSPTPFRDTVRVMTNESTKASILGIGNVVAGDAIRVGIRASAGSGNSVEFINGQLYIQRVG